MLFTNLIVIVVLKSLEEELEGETTLHPVVLGDRLCEPFK